MPLMALRPRPTMELVAGLASTVLGRPLGQVAAAIIAATILHFPCPFTLYPSIIPECPFLFTLDSSINPDLLHPDLLPRCITQPGVVQRQSNLSPRLLINDCIVSLYPNMSPSTSSYLVRVHSNQLSFPT